MPRLVRSPADSRLAVPGGRVWLAMLAGALLVALAPTEVGAFQRSVTCGPQSRFRCDVGEDPQTVQWPSSCVVVHLSESGSADLEFDVIERITHQSLNAWSRVECSEFSLIFGGYTNEDRVGYNPSSGDNANVLVFRDDFWPHEPGVLALTSVTFDRQNGDIVDADIEFNTHDFRYTAAVSQFGTIIDLQNTLVHELGHLIGLDHSLDREASMFGSAPEGETLKRTLAEDDIAGVCAIYPVGDEGLRPICNRHQIGFYEKPELAMNESPPDDCTVAAPRRAPRRGTRAALLALFGAFGLVLLTRRRRAR